MTHMPLTTMPSFINIKSWGATYSGVPAPGYGGFAVAPRAAALVMVSDVRKFLDV